MKLQLLPPLFKLFNKSSFFASLNQNTCPVLDAEEIKKQLAALDDDGDWSPSKSEEEPAAEKSKKPLDDSDKPYDMSKMFDATGKLNRQEYKKL